MLQLFKRWGEQSEHIALVIVISILGMIAYALTSSEPKSARIKSMLAGGIISMILSYPTWLAIGDWYGKAIAVYWLVPITFVYTITSQFIPDALRSLMPKLFNSLVKKFYKDKTGEDLK